jgi:hypothetical protein
VGPDSKVISPQNCFASFSAQKSTTWDLKMNFSRLVLCRIFKLVVSFKLSTSKIIATVRQVYNHKFCMRLPLNRI